MQSSNHTYPEYEADIHAAFDALASACGLGFVPGKMPAFANAHLELKFGIELQTPELYVTLQGHPTLTENAFWAAAKLPAYQPGSFPTAREHAQARLRFWAQALAPILPALAQGDLRQLALPDSSQADYEYKLRTYVYNHAPITHIARTSLWAPDWRIHAENYLAESGGQL